MGWHARRDQGASQEGSGLSRRTVAKGAAWATPLLVTSVAAPAYAASGPCVRQAQASLTTADADRTLLHVPAVDGHGDDRVVRDDGLAAATTPRAKRARSTTVTSSDPNWQVLKLHHPEGMDQDDTVTMTLKFSQAVTNLSLTITDIDKATRPSGSTTSSSARPPATTAVSRQPTCTAPARSANPFRPDQQRRDQLQRAGDVTADLGGPGQPGADHLPRGRHCTTAATSASTSASGRSASPAEPPTCGRMPRIVFRLCSTIMEPSSTS